MIDVGDIYLADVGQELRRPVLVLSNARFHDLSERALIAPAITDPVADTGSPWRLRVGRDLFLLDRLQSVPLTRLLDRVAAAPPTVIEAARQALAAITE